ncbi:classical arabinogalactan protein 26 [Rhododendron vialii]|uniref:classical arabinogalactan protein 26 n=1 Tax=Rhododendron vialii TaxID=182163 RepID=UPI0026602D18|nr:classical arabinogalactan protein 26 [Rhododendron vialii]
MASMRAQFTWVTILIACSSSLALPTSTISAAPAHLPNPSLPFSSPTLSPDITPLFPSPGGAGPPPAESPLPTIPSSRSPPDPFQVVAPGPSMADSPFGFPPPPSSVALGVSVSPHSVIFLGFVTFLLMQLSVV